MPNHILTTAARLQQDGPAAEARVDDALIALSSLMASVVTARRDTIGVSPVRGHAAIHRLMQAQRALVGVSGDMLRVHGALAEIGRETSGLDLHECPARARGAAPKLEVVG